MENSLTASRKGLKMSLAGAFQPPEKDAALTGSGGGGRAPTALGAQAPFGQSATLPVSSGPSCSRVLPPSATSRMSSLDASGPPPLFPTLPQGRRKLELGSHSSHGDPPPASPFLLPRRRALPITSELSSCPTPQGPQYDPVVGQTSSHPDTGASGYFFGSNGRGRTKVPV